MASESSGFAMARERLTHDMLNKPISAYPRISSAFDNGRPARAVLTNHRDIFEALSASQFSAPLPVGPHRRIGQAIPAMGRAYSAKSDGFRSAHPILRAFR
jgi:hypothetical protein